MAVTVEAVGLTKVFDGRGRAAVDHVDLAVEEGEYLVLLGPSGCGKTTLLRMIAGLEQPSSGEVRIGGEVVNGLPPRSRRIAMVFQSYALYPHKTVRQNIVFPLKAEKLPSEKRNEKVEWAAGLLGLTPLLDRHPRQLSGGERQRVALARALVRDPSVFLLDEPLSNLDAKLRTLARDDLKEFHERVGTTTIYVTHDQVEAMGMGDRIVVMLDGEIRQVGRPQDVYERPADTFVATFLGAPPMNLIPRGDIIVGFRPEKALPAEVLGGALDGHRVWTLDVRRIEYLSGDRHLHGLATGLGDPTPVIVRLPATVLTPIDTDTTHDFVLRESDLCTFDATTERADVKARLADRDGILARLMLLPAVLYIVALAAIPFVVAIAYSFSDVTAGNPSFDWAGFDNYRANWNDPVFRQALWNTIFFTVVTIALTVVFANIVALLLSAEFKGKRLVRFLILLPWTTPAALGAIAWVFMLDSLLSPLDWILQQVGILDDGRHAIWLGKPGLAKASVIGVQVWRLVPLAAVIILAGQTAIPDDIKDAAAVDGAGFWRRLWEITLPMTRPVIAVAVLFGAIVTITDMSVVRVLTNGAPVNETQVLASWAYVKGIDGGNLAQGAAVAVFLLPLLLAATVAILRAVRRWEVL